MKSVGGALRAAIFFRDQTVRVADRTALPTLGNSFQMEFVMPISGATTYENDSSSSSALFSRTTDEENENDYFEDAQRDHAFLFFK